MRKLHALCGVLVSTLTILLLTPVPAGAASTVSRGFTMNWVLRDPDDLRACVFVEVTGKMKGNYEKVNDPNGPDFYVWTKIKLVDPRVKIQGWPLRGAGCDSTKRVKLTKAVMRVKWYKENCRLGASWSVGIPWSVSATPTLKCGKEKVLFLKNSDDENKTTYKYSYEGTSGGFKNELSYAPSSDPANRIAYGVDVKVKVTRNVGAASQTSDFPRKHKQAFLWAP